MENNNMMNEVMEKAAENVVATTSNGHSTTYGSIALAVVAGGLLANFVVRPAVKAIKNRVEDRKARKYADIPTKDRDGDSGEDSEE